MRDTVADVLAAFRLTRLVIADDLPPVLAARQAVTGWVRRQYGPEWAEGLSCPWCCGAHLSLAVVLMRRVSWWPTVRDALAVSGAVGLLAAIPGVIDTDPEI